MRSYRKSSHTVHDLKVHLVWITKYRYQVLTKEVGLRIRELGKVYWGKHFWAVGYAAFSSGQITDEMIQEYLKNHDEHPNYKDDNFAIR